MKKLTSLLLITFFISTTAYAQSNTSNWAGYYIGGSLSNFTGHNTDSSERYDIKESYKPTIFAGYNHDLSNNIILGGEISAKLGKNNPHEFGYEGYKYTTLIDFKVKAGYAYGNFLPYITAGYAYGRFCEDCFDNEDRTKYSVNGYLTGVGVDYQINKNWNAGLEFLSRKFNDLYDDNSEKGTVNNLSAKVFYKF